MSQSDEIEAAAGHSFRLNGRVAAGRTGELFHAIELATGREVVIKICKDDTQAGHTRFVAEGRIASRLQHPGIVPIYELGETADGKPFYTMKDIAGKSLRRLIGDIRNGDPKTIEKFPLVHLIEIFLKAAEAVAYGHAHEVIHGELCPASIIIGEYGEVTVMGWGKGGAQRVDRAADIRALGSLLYAIITLQEVVDESTSRAMLQNVLARRILGPACPNQLLPMALTVVVTLAMELDDSGRYQGVGELIEDVEAFVDANVGDAFDGPPSIAEFALITAPGIRAPATDAEIAEIADPTPAPIATPAPSPAPVAESATPESPRRGWIVGEALLFMLLAVALVFQTLERLRAERELGAHMMAAERAEVEQMRSAPRFIAEARKAIVLGDFDGAVLQIGAALDYAPQVAEAHLLQGQLLAATRKFANAVPSLETYCEMMPTDANAKRLLEACTRATAPVPPDVLDTIADALKEQDMSTLAEPFVRGTLERRSMAIAEFRARYPKWAETLVVAPDSQRAALDLSSSQIEDLDPIATLPLWDLTLSNTQISDLSPLASMHLTSLTLTDCRKLDTLAPLAGMPLKRLNIAGTKVSDLYPLQGMDLVELDVGRSRVRDLTPLAEMPLQVLVLFDTNVDDLTPIRGLPLESIDLRRSQVSDLEPLAGMPLVQLRGSTRIADIRPLAGAPLRDLNLTGSLVKDLSAVANMRLHALSISFTPVTNLSPLRGQPIEILRIEKTSVRDLTPLSGMPLKQLTFWPEDITRGLDVVRNMPSITQVGWGNAMVSPVRFWGAFDSGTRIGERPLK
jgi:tRNA A-37 threonylcarbamoyl transferase component Bud32